MKLLRNAAFTALFATLTACSPNMESMSTGLTSAKGWNKPLSDCYAERLADIMDKGSYNRVADLLGKGATFKDALTMTRRATGKSYIGKINSDSKLQACMDQ